MKRNKPLSLLLFLTCLSFIIPVLSFSQTGPVFLPEDDSSDIVPLEPTVDRQFRESSSLSSPTVRVAYIIPSNRTEQPGAVETLQTAIEVGQEWFKGQMVQNGFDPKTFIFETEPGTTRPLIHVVHIDQTDDYLRGEDQFQLWTNTLQAISQAGVSVWAPGEAWVIVPETHLMLSDGSVIGGVGLGASGGTGNDPGVAMIGSDILPFFKPALEHPFKKYDGEVLPLLGPYPMRQNKTAPWFEGETYSSVASSRFGALFHELCHALGLGHDYRNDDNFHGNLLYNGLRGVRGSLFPELFPRDYTRLAYSSALVLNENHYFNRDKIVTPYPELSFITNGTVVPKQGHIEIKFRASDNDQLSFALLRFNGNTVDEMILSGTNVETSFVVPYYDKGKNNEYTVAVYDKQGNNHNYHTTLYVPSGYNQAPIPHIRIEPPIPEPGQPISLQSSRTIDSDHATGLLKVEWDVDNDGQYDIGPVPPGSIQYSYQQPGNYLIRIRVTDPAGAQTVSTPVSINIPEEPRGKVESLTLINAETDQDLQELKDGDLLILADLPTEQLNIRADVVGQVESVRLKLEGPLSRNMLDNGNPYALFGNNGSDYLPGNLPPGDYTLTATPYSQDDATGQFGTPLIIHFEVLRSSKISSLTLINAETDEDIQELQDRDVLVLADLPTQQLNVRAKVVGSVQSVRLKLEGPLSRNMLDNGDPYALFGNNGPDYLPGHFALGEYTLTVTPYSEDNAMGQAGEPLEVHFRVVSDNAVTSLTLINAETDQDLQELKDGEVLVLADLPTKQLNVRANVAGSVQSVRLKLEGPRNRNMLDNGNPYALFGNNGPDYLPGYFPLGDYTLTVTPYSEDNAMGQAGEPLAIQFAVVDQTLAGTSARNDDSELRQSSSLQLSASPNPGANEVSMLAKQHPHARVEVVITNQYGWPLRRLSFETDRQEVSRFRVDVSDLPTGIYMIQAQLGNKRETIRLIRD